MSQKKKMQQMFDNIAPSYDCLNHIMSLGIDRLWRRHAIKEIVDPDKTSAILDVACGTGDFSIAIAKRLSSGSHVQGVDLSENMLAVMREKVRKARLEQLITCEQGDCEQLRFAEGTFDRVTVAFGVRNFEHRETALREMLRVLNGNGKLVILELSLPSCPIIRRLYTIYFKHIMPVVGGIISGNKAAYRYLPASVIHFPQPQQWMATMTSCGFTRVNQKAFSLGICRMYIGYK